MILEDNVLVGGSHGDLIYPFATSQSTFNTYLDSQQNSPARFIQKPASYHIYSNDKPPAPPPYHHPHSPHLSTVMPLRTRSPLVQPRLITTANLHSSSPPTTAPPPAPGSLGSKRRRRNASEVQKQPFYALVKAADSSSELYARPPSDHFYFKITDGKTEFI